MTATEIADALRLAVPDLQVEVDAASDQPTVILRREQIVEACTKLRDGASDGSLPRFALLSDVTAVDWLPADPRFELVYHLVSVEPPQRLRLKVRLPAEQPHLATVTTVWPGANWLEREVFDMFGIIFDSHPDLRRLLTPEDWEGHPLRKDYPVQVDLPVKVLEPLQMTQEEFRKAVEGDRKARGAASDSGPESPVPDSQ
jgi:NADH-quinone oxidoreductase subunit C